VIEYLVVVVQQGRCTWENGQWLGKVRPSAGDPDMVLTSCPELHVYLNGRGVEGWDLVSVATSPQYDRLYLKRKRS
jgi:hypothetical protein